MQNKILTTILNNFSGGISNDLRVNDGSKFALTKHFDAFTYPHKLVPHRSTVTEEAGSAKAFKIKKFLYAPYVTDIFYMAWDWLIPIRSVFIYTT
jgi:hypothetical protein